MFTWKPIYKELAKALLAYKSRQPELVAILNEIKNTTEFPTIRLVDAPQPANTPILKEIDPFTFFADFNRGLKDQNRIGILTILKEKFHLQSPLPTDFNGIPVVDNMQSWFFPYAFNRKPDDISSLWQLAEATIFNKPEQLDPKIFDRCLKIFTVGIAKMTMGMFWLNPDEYLALDEKNTQCFASSGINKEVTNHASYLILLNQVRGKLGEDFTQISRSAWGSATNIIQYWAGGSTWGDVKKSDEFINGNFWQIGWKKDDEAPAAKRTWANYENVKVGDEFAIKGYGGQNDLRVYYIGKVLNKAGDGILKLQQLDRPLFRDKGPHGLAGASWFDTLVPIKNTAIIAAIFKGQKETSGEETKLKGEPLVSDIKSLPAPRNLILYGPPGTGKTYQTTERAVKIIEPGFVGDHAACKARFDALRSTGRIEFITFHQSYSYEDFVEGLRPVVDPDEEASEARYHYCPGVFKRLAVEALYDCLKPGSPGANHATFDELWNQLVEQIELDPDKKYPGLTDKTSYRLSVSAKGNLDGMNVLSNKTFLCTRSVIEKVFAAKSGSKTVSSSEVLAVVVRGCHSHFVAAIFNELKRIETSGAPGRKTAAALPPSPEKKAEIVQAYLREGKQSGFEPKPLGDCRGYILVIDEINRGNISKIMGELITLIEPDKRLGAEESLVVTLPYTGHRFAVPRNLHILGTMNTADKSIALVDLALRRRFEFEELRPNFKDVDICKQLTPQMRTVVENLNRRICLRKDRDHQIGHAYFIRVADEAGFNTTFRRHVIPLLQEYFFNDWEGLRYVLGEAGNQAGGFIRPMADGVPNDARTKWQWFHDVNGGEIDCLQVLVGNYQLA